MIIAITATQNGMTQRQKDALRQLFRWLHDIYLTSSDLASEDSIFIHPGYNPNQPNDESKAAFRDGVMMHSALPYLRRNKYIAGCIVGFETDLLIACPKEDTEQLRSGTWSTVRYARKAGTPRIILLP